MSYDQGQLSTSIWSTLTPNGPRVRSDRGLGFPYIVRRETEFNPGTRLQMDQSAYTHIPQTGLITTEPLNLAQNLIPKVSEPFQFKDLPMGRFPPTVRLRVDNPYEVGLLQMKPEEIMRLRVEDKNAPVITWTIPQSNYPRLRTFHETFMALANWYPQGSHKLVEVGKMGLIDLDGLLRYFIPTLKEWLWMMQVVEGAATTFYIMSKNIDYEYGVAKAHGDYAWEYDFQVGIMYTYFENSVKEPGLSRSEAYLSYLTIPLPSANEDLERYGQMKAAFKLRAVLSVVPDVPLNIEAGNAMMIQNAIDQFAGVREEKLEEKKADDPALQDDNSTAFLAGGDAAEFLEACNADDFVKMYEIMVKNPEYFERTEIALINGNLTEEDLEYLYGEVQSDLTRFASIMDEHPIKEWTLDLIMTHFDGGVLRAYEDLMMHYPKATSLREYMIANLNTVLPGGMDVEEKNTPPPPKEDPMDVDPLVPQEGDVKAAEEEEKYAKPEKAMSHITDTTLDPLLDLMIMGPYLNLTINQRASMEHFNRTPTLALEFSREVGSAIKLKVDEEIRTGRKRVAELEKLPRIVGLMKRYQQAGMDVGRKRRIEAMSPLFEKACNRVLDDLNIPEKQDPMQQDVEEKQPELRVQGRVQSKEELDKVVAKIQEYRTLGHLPQGYRQYTPASQVLIYGLTKVPGRNEELIVRSFNALNTAKTKNLFTIDPTSQFDQALLNDITGKMTQLESAFNRFKTTTFKKEKQRRTVEQKLKNATYTPEEVEKILRAIVDITGPVRKIQKL